MNNVPPHRRNYNQTARARAAEETGQRILDAFQARLFEGWFDEIRLEDVARDAGVSVQTVIRRYGGKDGLLEAAHLRLGEEIQTRRVVEPGDVAGAISALIEDYETVGDFVMRCLGQEDRHPVMRRMTDVGRTFHREWLERVFAPWLHGLPARETRAFTDAVVIATDVYVWKLLRRDLARPIAEYRRQVETLITAALAGLSTATAGAPR